VGSWFSKRETTDVPGESESTATAEAEARLKELERHRPDYALAGATHVTDLERRLRETAEWCSRHLDLTAIGGCLRPRSIAPQFLARDRWRSVSDVTSMRRQELNRLGSRANEMPQGRFLVYYPEAELSDGAAEVASQEFFDVYNAPPWGTWVGYFEDPGLDESGYGSYVLAWVPQELEEVVNSGIEVNPEACIAWLDQANVGVRSIIEMLHVT
jgi:hypothetical protein